MMQRMTLLEDVLYEPRPLLQHVIDDPAHTPVREPERKAGFDELFFDLIIVAVVRPTSQPFGPCLAETSSVSSQPLYSVGQNPIWP
jgi:hypothetical protein